MEKKRINDFFFILLLYKNVVVFQHSFHRYHESLLPRSTHLYTKTNATVPSVARSMGGWNHAQHQSDLCGE
jgi:hypothetical protein